MIRNIYKSHLPSVNYFFRNGMQAAFMMGRYETADESQIQQLDAEVKSGHPHIYVDPTDATVDTEAPTPMELIRAEAYAQAKADLLAAGTLNLDKTSTSNSGEFSKSITNTNDIAEGAMGSDAGSAAAAIPGAAPTGISGASLMKLSAANIAAASKA